MHLDGEHELPLLASFPSAVLKVRMFVAGVILNGLCVFSQIKSQTQKEKDVRKYCCLHFETSLMTVIGPVSQVEHVHYSDGTE